MSSAPTQAEQFASVQAKRVRDRRDQQSGATGVHDAIQSGIDALARHRRLPLFG
jgi:hypothetical protein